MRMVLSGLLLAGWVSAVGGCQSWSQVGQGVPSGARVPAPGTGTYQLPTSYYNNGARTGAVSTTTNPAASATATGVARTASQPLPSTGSAGATTGATTASWQPPSIDQMRSGINNTASAVFEDVGNKTNQVVQAGTTRAATAAEKYTAPAQQLPSSSASQSMSDDQPSADTSLDWQPPR